MKGRFAPSPTGRMHLGNIYSALLSYLSAKSQKGQWVLRIEDIDPDRSRIEFTKHILDDLQWLGMPWDEGPYYQSQHGAISHQHLEQLNSLGLVYPCHCTRAEIMATQAPHESDGRVVYKGTCRPINPQPMDTVDTPQKLRLIVPDRDIHFTDHHYGPHTVNLSSHCGDFILRRADGAWAYQIAVVLDDALMGITEVVRGRDLLLSTAQQIYLHQLLGFTPPSFAHLPLLCNSSMQRLSKRDKSLDMSHLRTTHTAPQIIGILAHHAGLIPSPEPLMPQDLIPLFSWAKVPTSDIILK
ncbi:MAG: tRNA glutamyl-Q(34) synthetase GluQRS [Prevotellaceae bacterium]|nr:tRNA glutamyl-Q(34) synthetase GluQRS [Candidatus Minthosoma caballi]